MSDPRSEFFLKYVWDKNAHVWDSLKILEEAMKLLEEENPSVIFEHFSNAYGIAMTTKHMHDLLNVESEILPVPLFFSIWVDALIEHVGNALYSLSAKRLKAEGLEDKKVDKQSQELQNKFEQNVKKFRIYIEEPKKKTK